jgi:hypothetical protein
MTLRLCQIQYGTTGRILFSISPGQEVSVKSKRRHFWKNWNEWNSNPGGLNSVRLPSWSTMHLEVDQKYYLHQKKRDGLVHPVLDSFDKYKILSERMNVLTIYIPCRKLPVASNLSTVHVCTYAYRENSRKWSNSLLPEEVRVWPNYFQAKIPSGILPLTVYRY